MNTCRSADSKTARCADGYAVPAPFSVPPHEAAQVLGNGSRVAAQDTAPFTLSVTSTHLSDTPSTIATCLAADGDIDTTSAIVDGIVDAYSGCGTDQERSGVPEAWIVAREPLPSRASAVRVQHREPRLGLDRIRPWCPATGTAAMWRRDAVERCWADAQGSAVGSAGPRCGPGDRGAPRTSHCNAHLRRSGVNRAGAVFVQSSAVVRGVNRSPRCSRLIELVPRIP